MPKELIDLELTLLHETQPRGESQGAFLVTDGDLQIWLPKSQVEYDGHKIFTLPHWLAKEKGLI